MDQKWSKNVTDLTDLVPHLTAFNSRIRMKTPQQVLFILFDKHRLQLSKVKETQLLGEISVLSLIMILLSGFIWYVVKQRFNPAGLASIDVPRDFQTFLKSSHHSH